MQRKQARAAQASELFTQREKEKHARQASKANQGEARSLRGRVGLAVWAKGRDREWGNLGGGRQTRKKGKGRG